MKIETFDDIVLSAATSGRKPRIAVVQAQDEHTLQALIKAKNYRICDAVLYGHRGEITEILEKLGADENAFEIVHAENEDESIEKAVSGIRAGAAGALMKGKLVTTKFMGAVVSKKNGLLSGRLVSQMGFYQVLNYHKIFGVTDFAMNPNPDLDQKKAIIENAVSVFHRIGVDCPKVAVMAPSEIVSPRIQEAVDGDILKQMNKNGEITNCIVEGPISFDLAMDARSAATKGYDSPVAGDADLLVVPNITAGNILVKALTMFAGSPTAGITLGAKVPVIMTSRSAPARDKFYAIALAACAAEYR